MILLITHAHETIARVDDPHLGRLIQPRHTARIADTAAAGITWAADNDAFNGWTDRAATKYLAMLDLIAGLPGCRFVALPDVVGDARATADRFNQWHAVVAGRGLPVALVAQDGIAELGVPWSKIDALFIGGSTMFKLGPVARDLAHEAKQRGVWVHMGRVNSERRIAYAKAIGCDSIDGTKYARFTDTWLARGVEHVKRPAAANPRDQLALSS